MKVLIGSDLKYLPREGDPSMYLNLTAISSTDFKKYGCIECGFKISRSHVEYMGTKLCECCRCHVEFITLPYLVGHSIMGICGEEGRFLYPVLREHPLKPKPNIIQRISSRLKKKEFTLSNSYVGKSFPHDLFGDIDMVHSTIILDNIEDVLGHPSISRIVSEDLVGSYVILIDSNEFDIELMEELSPHPLYLTPRILKKCVKRDNTISTYTANGYGYTNSITRYIDIALGLINVIGTVDTTHTGETYIHMPMDYISDDTIIPIFIRDIHSGYIECDKRSIITGIRIDVDDFNVEDIFELSKFIGYRLVYIQ